MESYVARRAAPCALCVQAPSYIWLNHFLVDASLCVTFLLVVILAVRFLPAPRVSKSSYSHQRFTASHARYPEKKLRCSTSSSSIHHAARRLCDGLTPPFSSRSSTCPEPGSDQRLRQMASRCHLARPQLRLSLRRRRRRTYMFSRSVAGACCACEDFSLM